MMREQFLKRCLAGAMAYLALAGQAAMADDWQTLYGIARAKAQWISRSSLTRPFSQPEWKASLAERRAQWLEMLGLSPLPQRSDLRPQVTGILEREDYVVEKLYFESLPGAYVIGNLYRPAKIEGKLPAVLYLCGHSLGKVNPTYQAHPRWFAQHGYVALVLDPIQLGESQGFHHGTYRDSRWDWYSRGYTPAGTEVWNAMRALDYLESRPDVDSERMGVTGLSGGGVISWCLGAADERVKVVVPVCQSGSIEQAVTDRSTDGHCDCAFWINYRQWCWSDIGSLIAPRALMIASGSEDVLWRPSGYREVAHRLERQYDQLQIADKFSLIEDESPHGYTPALRRGIFQWFNTHLKNDPSPVTDDVTDFVEPTENLLVFQGKPPSVDQMQRADTLLVQRPALPSIDEEMWPAYQQRCLEQLRQVTFRNTVSTGTPLLREVRDDGTNATGRLSSRIFESYDRMALAIRVCQPLQRDTAPPSGSSSTLVFALQPEARSGFQGGGGSRPAVSPGITTAAVEVRNTAATSLGPGYLWTARRTYPLLGQTLPERQVSDLLAAIELLRKESPSERMTVYGDGVTAPLAIYTAIMYPDVAEIVLANPPATHEEPSTPEFLGILRIGDLPHNLALAYPRPITFVGSVPPAYSWTRQVYEALGAADRIRIIPRMQAWQPYLAPQRAE